MASRLGLFDASPTQVIHGVKDLGVTDVDNMRSDNLGAPESAYYRDQSVADFDRKYRRLQKRVDGLLGIR